MSIHNGLIPGWQAANILGISKDEIADLCERGLIRGAKPVIVDGRENGNWMTPERPIRLERPDDEPDLPAPMMRPWKPPIELAPHGMVPLVVATHRAQKTLQAMTRLCRLGRIEGARQVAGRWFVPDGFTIAPVRRGRPPLQLLPEWLK